MMNYVGLPTNLFDSKGNKTFKEKVIKEKWTFTLNEEVNRKQVIRFGKINQKVPPFFEV